VPALAAASLATAVTAGALLYAFRDDRRLADHYRATLAQAHGSSFTAVQLHTTTGAPGGTLFAYRGTPSWIIVTVTTPYRTTVERAELVSRDGRTIPLPAFRLSSGSWGGALPVDPATIAGLHLLDSDGRPLLLAYLPRSW
jgi:hypothetical protein